MTSTDDLFDQIFDEATTDIERLGLRSIPFTESAINLNDADRLSKIFTGRTSDLKRALSQFQGRDRRRLLVYGKIGSGKSAFVLQVLNILKRKRPKMLAVYATLPDESDLTTTAFIALAQNLPGDEWAQSQLHEMGLPAAQPQKERTSEAGASGLFTAKISEKDRTIQKIARPVEALQQLIERARKRYPDGVVIAIDDLDKQDPARIRRLMHDAQGTLKGQASFILTGHPIGMIGDILTTERGLFDEKIELGDLDLKTTEEMLSKYLASVRLPNHAQQNSQLLDFRPFTPKAARAFCRASIGRPRLFNRLGNTVLTTAMQQGKTTIDFALLRLGLKASELSRREHAHLADKEERLRELLTQRGTLSDEEIRMEDLEQLGFRTFNEILPLLEKLEDADLATRNELGYATEFKPINADQPFGDFPETESIEP
jgi:hypothetical protein